jgi:hypothetical protein
MLYYKNVRRTATNQKQHASHEILTHRYWPYYGWCHGGWPTLLKGGGGGWFHLSQIDQQNIKIQKSFW